MKLHHADFHGFVPHVMSQPAISQAIGHLLKHPRGGWLILIHLKCIREPQFYHLKATSSLSDHKWAALNLGITLLRWGRGMFEGWYCFALADFFSAPHWRTTYSPLYEWCVWSPLPPQANQRMLVIDFFFLSKWARSCASAQQEDVVP